MGCGSSLVPNLDHVDITHFTKIRAIGKGLPDGRVPLAIDLTRCAGGFGLVHVVTVRWPPATLGQCQVR